MNTGSTKFKFKITVIGDGMVGKTSLIKKFTKGTFGQDYVKTIGAQFSVFDKEINDHKIRLLFWDIAGQIEFNFVRTSFFNKSQAAIIVYSLEDNDHGKKSFKHVVDWYKEICKYCGEIPVMVFANKVDLVKENSSDDSKIQNLVDNHNLLGFYKTSAKTGFGVIEAFSAIIDKLYLSYI
jgi:small GTP-binding protein